MIRMSIHQDENYLLIKKKELHLMRKLFWRRQQAERFADIIFLSYTI